MSRLEEDNRSIALNTAVSIVSCDVAGFRLHIGRAALLEATITVAESSMRSGEVLGAQPNRRRTLFVFL